MLIFCLLLFQFPKIKTKTFPPVTTTGPPPPTNVDASTSLQRPSINASVVFKSMTRNKYREIALSFHQLASIHRIHQPRVYFVKAYDDKADDKVIGKRPVVEMQ